MAEASTTTTSTWVSMAMQTYDSAQNIRIVEPIEDQQWDGLAFTLREEAMGDDQDDFKCAWRIALSLLQSEWSRSGTRRQMPSETFFLRTLCTEAATPISPHGCPELMFMRHWLYVGFAKMSAPLFAQLLMHTLLSKASLYLQYKKVMRLEAADAPAPMPRISNPTDCVVRFALHGNAIHRYCPVL